MYTAIWKSIQRLAGTRIDLELFSGKGRKRKDLKELTGSILSFADIDRETGSIRVVVNPYFLQVSHRARRAHSAAKPQPNNPLIHDLLNEN